ncbi:carboxymuconolactone decarboxylase family protein [Sinomicrobium pectinilyticum]|uniref:Carboxymuconolactone decarboxylase family protein n=1 Tax=Sinomicrobium pectinilyticum TaxID=1084421 RepID=A0A3N0EUM7_SINP1|nr:carboxymuconolactone decarboxylase family protein [Sinomicrobium pectinilyticum]RNL91462.1 carboxymuconolactone decarboxylase family protein [Sinomicrobium pectinilyticum]
MESRIQVDKLQPEAYKAIIALEGHLSKTSELSTTHRELIKIRASQINGCAFCIAMHTKDALKYGETQERIFLLDAWKETNLFSEEEKVILAITEEITFIHQNGLTQNTYNRALNFFSETYLAQIIMAVTMINVWNRIAISTHKPIIH